MLTEDNLMRWIRLVTATIARAAGLRVATLYFDALFLLDQTLETLVGLKADLLNNLDEEGLISILTGPDGLDTDRLQLVADLTKSQADVYAAQGMDEESVWRYQRALNFYLAVMQQGGPLRAEPPYPEILELSQLLTARLPPATLFALFDYFDSVGRFDQADLALDRLMTIVAPQDDLAQTAREFYQELLSKPDLDLNGGGISREQVLHRLDKLSNNP